MPTPIKPIRVMLSSRNRDLIPDGKGAVLLSDVRKQLQNELQTERFCDQALVEVWINEEAGAEDGTGDAWEQCLKQIDEADIVIGIYNGQAGWTKDSGGPGICHEEIARALSLYPAKLRLIRLKFGSNKSLRLISPDEATNQTTANRAFADFVETSNLFLGFASDRESLVKEVKLAVAKAVVDLVALSKREIRKGKYHLGSPLDWSRLSYQERKNTIEEAARKYLRQSKAAEEMADGLVWTWGSAKLLFLVHGVPAGFGIAEARELVGRPFLHDHRKAVARSRSNLVGPLHIIACHKSCTESQIISFMGHPDLFIVQAPFGFFVADQLSFAQIFFLANCRDQTTTHTGLRSLFDWIDQSGEMKRIVKRAKSRAAIMRTTAEEIEKASK